MGGEGVKRLKLIVDRKAAKECGKFNGTVSQDFLPFCDQKNSFSLSYSGKTVSV